MDPIPHDFSDRLSSDREWWLTLNKQGNVGRCQYGISMEGEELGTDKMMVTGRKVEYPFYIELLGQKTSTHPSYMWVYIKHDFIIYIRPDLQIVTLGK